jgi:hypothetical protein
MSCIIVPFFRDKMFHVMSGVIKLERNMKKFDGTHS